MPVRFQVTIDCADIERQVHFWASVLGYQIKPPPAGFGSWREFYRSIGVSDEELGDFDGSDRLIDPDGAGPPFWFQQVPEGKVVKNRIHLDIFVSGGREVPMATRKERVDAEADRLIGLGATKLPGLDEDGVDHYAALMRDPEGNEFCVC
jgi:catechol 2,3-dioxygenase-like lactoylglutathione lyase family enzyme